MLTYSPLRIPEPLTKLDDVLRTVAVRNFGDLLRCMGDRPSGYIGDKEQPIVAFATKDSRLCDEVYVQVMKQLTLNPSVESCTKGWRLLLRLIKSVLPSAELCEFLHAFL